MMSLHARAFWLPKEGNRVDEWEDACAYSESRLALALSDGASSSYRAQDWASTLVDHFLLDPPRASEVDVIEAWVADCARLFESLPAPVVDAWYVDEMANRGAFATFLGFQLSGAAEAEHAEWAAIAVGDTCLFHIRDGRRIQGFPIESPDCFTTTPPLLASTERHNSRGAGAAVVTQGTCVAGDTFLLATDALAQWSLRAELEDSDVWRMLSSIHDHEFLALMSHVRGAHGIENDDVTLLRGRVEKTASRS
jgi:hypothetical protein